jgi:formylglycine-generating enzyme required for sulfatase activity
VSAADALAYARWAGKTLPTGQQWEKAARGNRGSVFPWCDDFSAGRCNVRESQIGGTTAVTRFEEEASPYGVVDLCGNVWEWCASTDVGGSMQTRGGSFRSPGPAATPSSWRARPVTASRDDLGFRCALSLEDGLAILSV